MNWQLVQVNKTDWKQDNSGCYTLINWISKDNNIRLDIMDKNDMPVVSFQGQADDVRKHVMQWQDSKISQKAGLGISCEHASYIGAELVRCALLKNNYIQD